MNDNIRSSFFKVPFSTYDIFGYLIPGATFLTGVYLFEFFLFSIYEKNIFPLFYIFTLQSHLDNSSFLQITIYILILVLIAYVTGHVISSISSYLLDRILVEKGYGYPYQILLEIKRTEFKNGRASRYIRGLFFWLNVYLVLRYLSYIYASHIMNEVSTIIIWGVIIVSVFSLFGLLLIRIGRKQKHYNVNVLFLVNILKKYDWFMRHVFAGGLDFLGFLFSNVVKTRYKFDDEFIQKFKKYFESTFHYNPETASTNNFWFAYLFVTEKSPKADVMLTNWLSLYSFARNLSTCFFILFIYCFFILLYYNNIFVPFNNNLIIIVPLLYYSCFLIMLLRYYYLYENYFSKFLFRSFVYLNEVNHYSTDLTKKREIAQN
jgi:hypothetical protein